MRLLRLAVRLTLCLACGCCISVIETDGPYGGYSCSNSSHIHHHGEGDSVYMQVRGQGDFYKELRNKGFFINAPDDYFFQVSSCFYASRQTIVPLSHYYASM